MSYNPTYVDPPPVTHPYKPEIALDDLPCVTYALDTFLSSKMHECEDYMNESDQKKQRLYFATGYGLIQCVKGLMSYADEDLLDALGHTKQGVLIASQHRKKAPMLASRLAGYVVSSLNTTGLGFIKSMTDVERHAELVYAESLFEKALLGIVYSGDWLAFVKEALNMRTIIGIYRSLYKYITVVDAEYAATGAGKEDPAIDDHFRSGVYLGAGMSTLILSLLPSRLLSIVEIFGYAADRAEALEILGRAGGWGGRSARAAAQDKSADAGNAFTADMDHPGLDDEDVPPLRGTDKEGVRRSICDMALLIFHLVLSSFTFDRVDVPMAARIVKWNLKRYPTGVFFLFGAGRLALVRSQPARAIEFHTRAMAAQTQYRNLHHVSYWEMAIANLALVDVRSSAECWKVLEQEATWSKSIYSYGRAVCLLASVEDGESKEGDGDKEKREEALRLMKLVPTLRQKIAGKSIPLEKFVARKARKCIAQNGRLLLPALELSVVFLGIAHAPRRIVEERMLPQVRSALAELKEGAQGYWDDLALARYLEGLCLRYIAFPDPDAVLDPAEVPALSRDEAANGAKACFEAVFKDGEKIELDHHIVYHAHYELGRLLACLGDEAEARRHLELVLSGKYLEVGPSGRKGRYSMENALHMRANAAVEALHQKRL
ncbi:hypothetical protein FB45DRAFT_938308 [Roridomyces roridus]|uniref:Tetratricopeptide repeat protein 39B n=1 Tax=Roridomyces roridus TaxID=1738132 RepID=A0AAD7FDC3_9AGAR|nr:hypothetical protein FB45DRAFT_938308 [Roridomyces roridus]